MSRVVLDKYIKKKGIMVFLLQMFKAPTDPLMVLPHIMT